jgi:hypothetical protein
MLRVCSLVGFLLGLTTISAAQPAKKTFPPDGPTRAKIEEQTRALGDAIAQLRGTPLEELLPDVEIYSKAARWTLLHEEWYQKESVAWTLEALATGQERLEKLKGGKLEWLQPTGKVVHGYRSKIDGSVQPYAVSYPRNFNSEKTYRLDVVLHGRDANLNEVKFLHQHRGGTVPATQDFIQLDVFGRGNNAYRWAGEADVLEALRHFYHASAQYHTRYNVDPNRIVLRGFSMGGAGAWHLGLHYPSLWRAVSPGAGFTATKGYVKNLPEPLPSHQEACLRIYDAVAVAENVFCTPFIAYGGEKDPQLQAAKNIEALVKPLGTPFRGAFPLQVIVGPDTAHKYHPQALQKIMQQLQHYAETKQPDYPPVIRFVPTMHHAFCHWVQVLALTQQYAPALVEAEYLPSKQFRVKTQNIAVLQLFLPGTFLGREVRLEIDGQTVSAAPFPTSWDAPLRPQETRAVLLERQNGQWQVTYGSKWTADLRRQPRKYVPQCGPIDDAFRQPFLCVQGTGRAWNTAVQAHAQQELARFQREWKKYFRGELPVVRDVDLVSSDLTSHHLILFGDPGSNLFIQHALGQLPVAWTREQLRFGGKTYSAADHLPKLIYPSPFQAGKYVVLNSGHTFHAADFEGTNALLYPHLGDYAIVKVKTGGKGESQEEIVRVGLFDEQWRVISPRP